MQSLALSREKFNPGFLVIPFLLLTNTTSPKQPKALFMENIAGTAQPAIPSAVLWCRNQCKLLLRHIFFCCSSVQRTKKYPWRDAHMRLDDLQAAWTADVRGYWLPFLLQVIAAGYSEEAAVSQTPSVTSHWPPARSAHKNLFNHTIL